MMHLVTGGSASGKSSFAESLLMQADAAAKYYIATMRVSGEEGQRRVRKHRAARAGKGFLTLERGLDLAGLILPEAPDGGRRAALVECLSNLTANEQFETGGTDEEILSRMLLGVERLRAQADPLILVTNEVFSDGVRYEAETERYLSLLGRFNRCLAARADTVTEVVYGIPVCLRFSGQGRSCSRIIAAAEDKKE